MVVMQEGKIEEMGDADQIYVADAPSTQKLIDAIPEKLEHKKTFKEKVSLFRNWFKKPKAASLNFFVNN